MRRLELIGYWASEYHPGWPDPRDFIDLSWDERNRAAIARYLKNGQVISEFRGFSRCRLCGNPNGRTEQTDGTFYWPGGLAHYVSDHHVRLPDRFIEHVNAAEEAWDNNTEYDSDWWRAQAGGESLH